MTKETAMLIVDKAKVIASERERTNAAIADLNNIMEVCSYNPANEINVYSLQDFTDLAATLGCKIEYLSKFDRARFCFGEIEFFYCNFAKDGGEIPPAPETREEEARDLEE